MRVVRRQPRSHGRPSPGLAQVRIYPTSAPGRRCEMPEAEGTTTRHTDTDTAAPDTTRAALRLPGLDIDIVHRVAAAGDAEQISINLRAMPLFEAFGRTLETINPFAF